MKNVWLILIALFFNACGSNTTDNKETDHDTTATEQTYWESIQEYNPQKKNVVIDGKEIELIYFKSNEELVYEALEISKLDDPFNQEYQRFMDITNDDIDDSIIFYIKKREQMVFEKGIKIFSNNRLVFNNHVLADKNYFEYLESLVWIGDSSLHKLMPYSMIASLNFYTELPDYFTRTNIKKVISSHKPAISKHVMNYAQKMADEPEKKHADIMKYLDTYSGTSVSEIQLYEPSDEFTYVWYSPDSSFIPIYNYTGKIKE